MEPVVHSVVFHSVSFRKGHDVRDTLGHGLQSESSGQTFGADIWSAGSGSLLQDCTEPLRGHC